MKGITQNLKQNAIQEANLGANLNANLSASLNANLSASLNANLHANLNVSRNVENVEEKRNPTKKIAMITAKKKTAERRISAAMRNLTATEAAATRHPTYFAW